MALNEEIEGLARCIFQESGPEPLEERFYVSELHECGEEYFDDANILRGLKREFSTQTERICTSCTPEQPAKYCNSHSESDFERREYWKIDPDDLFQRWLNWVEQGDIFQKLDESEKLGQARWKVTGTFESGPIRFHIFMSSDALEAFNFERDTPEFGIAFLNPRHVEESGNADRTFVWSEVLRDGFAQELRQTREQLFGSFGDRLLSIEDLQTSKTLVEDSLRNYFKSVGYSRIEDNVGANCPEARRFELDVSAYGDFVAMKSDDEKVVPCECELVNDYHLHRFSDSQLVTASGKNGIDELDHLVDRIRSKANRRATLNKRISIIKTFVNLSAGVAAVAAIISLFNNVGQFASFLTDLFGGTPISKAASYLLLLVALAAIIFIVILVALVLFWEYGFDWNIEPPDELEASPND